MTCTNESSWLPFPVPLIKSTSRKRLIIATVKKNKGGKTFSRRRCFIARKKPKYPVLLPFLCKAKKAAARLEQWDKDRVIHLPKLEFLPSVANQEDWRYYSYGKVTCWNSSKCVTGPSTNENPNLLQEHQRSRDWNSPQNQNCSRDNQNDMGHTKIARTISPATNKTAKLRPIAVMKEDHGIQCYYGT